MSGVYIKGMEMPKDGEHPYWVVIHSDGTVEYNENKGQGWQTSEAVPVPDHGRLGDLDKLESGLRLCAKYQTGYRQQGMLGCCETIRTAPTIIPADKKEAE